MPKASGRRTRLRCMEGAHRAAPSAHREAARCGLANRPQATRQRLRTPRAAGNCGATRPRRLRGPRRRRATAPAKCRNSQARKVRGREAPSSHSARAHGRSAQRRLERQSAISGDFGAGRRSRSPRGAAAPREPLDSRRNPRGFPCPRSDAKSGKTPGFLLESRLFETPVLRGVRRAPPPPVMDLFPSPRA